MTGLVVMGVNWAIGLRREGDLRSGENIAHSAHEKDASASSRVSRISQWVRQRTTEGRVGNSGSKIGNSYLVEACLM